MIRAAAFVLALCLLSLRPALAAEAVILTDIHFNPLADKTLGDALAAAAAEEWPAILDRGTERMSSYGADTDWKLLRAALAAIAAQKKPDFVLLPGDFLVHSFRNVFNSSVTAHDDAAFRRFAATTLSFLALQLEAAFAHAPLFPVLGNNDSDCGDYGVQPGGAFLAATEPIAARMIGPALGQRIADDFAKSWSALGNYTVPNPAVPDEDIVAINDNFLSPNYRDRCGSAADLNPARATLDWLARTLAAAARAHRRVLLLYHIPPGTDGFATARHNSCPVTPAPLLAAPYAAEFHALMRRYRGTIVAQVAGHLHTDAFRILRERGAAFGFVMVAPALSPIFAQNPAFRRITLGDDGAIRDSTTFYLANLADAAAGVAPQWRVETSFDRAWNVARFDAAGLETLYRRIAASDAARERWIASYGVQGPASAALAAPDFALYRCSVGTDQTDDFARCLCGERR